MYNHITSIIPPSLVLSILNMIYYIVFIITVKCGCLMLHWTENWVIPSIECVTGADPDTLKRRGCQSGSSEKKGLLGHYILFTHENDKFSNKIGGTNPLHPLWIRHCVTKELDKLGIKALHFFYFSHECAWKWACVCTWRFE